MHICGEVRDIYLVGWGLRIRSPQVCGACSEHAQSRPASVQHQGRRREHRVVVQLPVAGRLCVGLVVMWALEMLKMSQSVC